MADYVVNSGDFAIEPYVTTPGLTDTIRFEDNVGRVQFISNGAAEVRITIDGSEPTVPDPGDSTSTFRLPDGVISVIDFPMAGSPDRIKVWSAGAVTVSVQVMV